MSNGEIWWITLHHPSGNRLSSNFVTMKALTLSSFGGSDVLEYREVNDLVLKKNDVLVEMKAIGMGFDVITNKTLIEGQW